MQPKLLIVDDDKDICIQMKWALSDDFEFYIAEDRASALTIFVKEQPAVVILDLGLPPQPRGVEEGFRVLSDILHHKRHAKVIIITGRAERQHAQAAVGQGAYDFFHKPIDIDELKVIIRRALHVYELEQEHRALPDATATLPFIVAKASKIIWAKPPAVSLLHCQPLFTKLTKS